MKTLFFVLFSVLFNIVVFAQCTTQFSKITKFEYGFKKDAYGQVTDQKFEKCTLPNGQVKNIYNTNQYFTKSWQSEHGISELLFSGLNTAKTIVFQIIKTENRIRVFATYFYAYSGKNYTDGTIDWDPSINDKIGTSRLYYDGFSVAEGWAFSKISGDILIMKKNGVEYKFVVSKTQEKNCKMYFKLMQ
jgi:hypothetical protein